MNPRLLFAITLLALAQLAQAGVYQWTDANGQTHFSDRPPEKSVTSVVQVNDVAAEPEPTVRQRHDKIVEFVDQRQKEREARQKKEAKARQQAKQQAGACRKLRARLKYMESISTFYNVNDQGQREFVSEAENKQIRERFQAKVHEKCGEI